MNEKSVVGIAKVKNLRDKSEIKNALFNLLDQMRARNKLKIKAKANIMIKPNICFVKGYETGTTVDPFLVKCLVEWLLKTYDIESIIIGEADATILKVDVAFKVLGWEEAFRQYQNIHLLNLTKDKSVNVDIDGLYLTSLTMPKSYMEADYLISFGKLKTHVQTGITCILKNQFGANPVKYKAKYHPYLDSVIHDMNKIRLPDLCLVDGIIAMEEEGPVDGRPKPLGLLIVGNDAVATDHACARIMDFRPKKISHLKLAIKQKLGNSDYDVFGENIEDVKTSFISVWTKLIKNKYVKKIPLLRKFIILCYLIKRAFEK